MAFLSAMIPVSSWTELQNAAQGSAGPHLIALTKSFPAESGTISIGRPLTISAVPGARALITRTAPSDPLFTVSGGDLTLGHPSGGTLVLDGGAIWDDDNHTGNSGIPATSPLVQVSAGSLTLSRGAELCRNHNTGSGGAVYVDSAGTFTMTGGSISGNKADSDGGGVYVSSSTTISFKKEPAGSGGSGVIYGDTDKDHTEGSNENTARNGGGHAVYVNGSPAKVRNDTAGKDDTLDSTTDGSGGGWLD
jgi:hypothetical protein